MSNNSLKKTFLIILFFSLITCVKNEEYANNRIISLEDAKSELDKRKILDNSLFRNKTSNTLSEVDIKKVYSVLDLSIEEYNQKNSKSKSIHLKNYRFYITPTLNKDGDLIVYIIAYCYTENDEWWNYSDFFMVRDGGNCFFRSAFKIPNENETLVTTAIITNGEA